MIIKQDYGQLYGGELEVESIISPVEKSFTADREYAVGSFFILDGVMYEVTQAIAQGGTIIIDTNCQLANTVMEYIESTGDFKEVTLTTDTSYIDNVNWTQCYSNGKMCLITFCFHLKGTTPANINIMTGFPTNSRQNHGSLTTADGGGARIRIISGGLQLEDTKSAGWVNGSLAYPISIKS